MYKNSAFIFQYKKYLELYYMTAILIVDFFQGEWYCALCEAITNVLDPKQHHIMVPPQHSSTSAMTVPQNRQAVYNFVDHPQYKGAKYEGCWKCGKIYGE